MGANYSALYGRTQFFQYGKMAEYICRVIVT